MIEKIISGGQIGADIAGIYTGKLFGIPTGGTMPKGFLTLDGPRPEYKLLYNMEEHTSPSYPPRTKKNVRDSNGTIRFAFNFNSAGEICTKKAIDALARPYLDIHLYSPKSDLNRISRCVEWLEKNNIKILNVAGNASKDAGEMTEIYLTKLFLKLGFNLGRH